MTPAGRLASICDNGPNDEPARTNLPGAAPSPEHRPRAAEPGQIAAGSANPVGRLVLHLFGRADDTRLSLSDEVCTGLQLANFWQDVAVDWQKDRVYLPQDEMAANGVVEEHIAQQRCDAAWRSLIGMQIDRARAMMLAGSPLGRALPGRLGLEIRTTMQGGLRILDKLEAAGCDMFRARPVLKWFDWPLLLVRSFIAQGPASSATAHSL